MVEQLSVRIDDDIAALMQEEIETHEYSPNRSDIVRAALRTHLMGPGACLNEETLELLDQIILQQKAAGDLDPAVDRTDVIRWLVEDYIDANRDYLPDDESDENAADTEVRNQMNGGQRTVGDERGAGTPNGDPGPVGSLTQRTPSPGPTG